MFDTGVVRANRCPVTYSYSARPEDLIGISFDFH